MHLHPTSPSKHATYTPKRPADAGALVGRALATAIATIALSLSAWSFAQNVPSAGASATAPATSPSPASTGTGASSNSKTTLTQTPLGPPFSNLTAYQAEVLKPLQPVWDELGEVRKRKWIEIANRLPTLSDDEKNRITQRMQEWAALTSQQRRQVRDNFTEAMGKTAAERQAQWEEYQKLSPEARAALAERAQQELRQRREAAASNPKAPVGAAATTRPSNKAVPGE